MKKFILTILSVMIAAATLFTACAKPTTDSDVSTGSGADVTNDVQSAFSGESGGVSTDDQLPVSTDESSVENRISSEDSYEETSEEVSEGTSDVVAVVTPVKPDDTSTESKSEASEAPVTDTPVESTTDPIEPTESKAPTEDNTSEEHIHKYKITVKYATCTTDGYTEHTCSCGDTYKTDITSAYGHYLYKKSSVAATLEAEGTELWKCARCNYSETKTTPKLVLYTISDEEIELICDKFIELLNEERAKLGAPALSTAPIAHEMAMVRANELTVLFSHQRPNSIEGIGSDSATIYYEYKYNPADTGYYGRTGESCYMPFSSSEDIAAIHTDAIIFPEVYKETVDVQTSAYNTAYSMIMNFSRSAGHWADLTDPEYTGVGVGYAYVNTPDGFSEYLCVMTMDKTYG